MVKSLADFPYTIYLLAFDREVVIRALGDVQKGDGAEYLEKVIQVPFELPMPNTDDIYQVFFKKFDSIISGIPEEKWDKEYWGEIFQFGIKPYLQSIRDVVRFANVFSLKYALLSHETNVIDLIGLTCIQVFEPEVYSRLPSHKEQLCEGSIGYYDQYQREKEKVQIAYDMIISGIMGERAENIKNILTRLFPKLNTIALNAFGYIRQYNHYEALQGGNIANPACFDRYFALTLETTAIPMQMIAFLLLQADEVNLAEGIVKINSLGKTTRFLEHICAVFETKKEKAEYYERAKIVFVQLTYHWHLLDDNDNMELFTVPFIWRLQYCTKALLQNMDENARFELVKYLFYDEKVAVSTIVLQLGYFEKQHNRFTEKSSKSEEEKLLTLEHLLELEKVFISRVINETESGAFLDNDLVLYILWLLEKIDEKTAQKCASNMIKTDIDLAKFISGSVGHGKGEGRTVYKIWQVRKDDINKYVNIESAFVRMKAFVHTVAFKNLSDEKKENIAAFLVKMEGTKDTMEFGDEILIKDIEKKLNEITN